MWKRGLEDSDSPVLARREFVGIQVVVVTDLLFSYPSFRVPGVSFYLSIITNSSFCKGGFDKNKLYSML